MVLYVCRCYEKGTFRCIWRSEPDISKRLECVRNYIFTKYNINECDEQVVKNVKKQSTDFCKKLKERWIGCHYILEKFFIFFFILQMHIHNLYIIAQ